jgi:hypothetical protein
MAFLCSHSYCGHIVSDGEIFGRLSDVLRQRAVLGTHSGCSHWNVDTVATGEHLVQVKIQVELIRRHMLSGSASTTPSSSESRRLITIAHSNILRVLHHASLVHTRLIHAILGEQRKILQRGLV